MRLAPWGMSRDETRQMRVFAVVALLHLIFNFFPHILQTFIRRCGNISINNSVCWAYFYICFYVCTAFYFFLELHMFTQKITIATVASTHWVSSCAGHCLVSGPFMCWLGQGLLIPRRQTFCGSDFQRREEQHRELRKCWEVAQMGLESRQPGSGSAFWAP